MHCLNKYDTVFVGTVTDGEYCSLRSKGENDITHLWDLIRQAKAEVRTKRKEVLESMLFPISGVFGHAQPLCKCLL